MAAMPLTIAAAGADQTIPPPPAKNIQLLANESWLYDSNPLRLAAHSQSISGSNTAIHIILNDNTPTSSLSANSEIDQGLFDNSTFDSTDFHEKLNLSTKNENWTVAMAGLVDYDTTRTSEISNYNIDIPNVRHLGLTASPEVDFQLDAVQKISLAGSVMQSTYQNAAFTDYDFYTLNPSYNYAFDPLDTGLFVVNAQRYTTTSGLSDRLDSLGPSLGWLRTIDPNTTARVTAGAEESKQTTAASTMSSSRLNYVFSANLSYKTQADKASFDASRSDQPFGNGSAALFTSFQARDQHAINEKLSLNAMASYRYAEYLQDSGTNLNREVVGSAGIAYHVYRNIDITTNYQYTHQTLTNTPGSVSEHVVMVGLSYHPFAIGL